MQSTILRASNLVLQGPSWNFRTTWKRPFLGFFIHFSSLRPILSLPPPPNLHCNISLKLVIYNVYFIFALILINFIIFIFDYLFYMLKYLHFYFYIFIVFFSSSLDHIYILSSTFIPTYNSGPLSATQHIFPVSLCCSHWFSHNPSLCPNFPGLLSVFLARLSLLSCIWRSQFILRNANIYQRVALEFASFI
jgi:hypothetical protein